MGGGDVRGFESVLQPAGRRQHVGGGSGEDLNGFLLNAAEGCPHVDAVAEAAPRRRLCSGTRDDPDNIRPDCDSIKARSIHWLLAAM
ncbi:hypothetical protein chiPu_0004833 [Chiloscyllium punctatum]|uniref:Uncharacterized protein n=1 Tax=Chiloscyllium punctatum TaxID=137246 RepID=A0A401S7R0_CHIPU|nr:hypothetical protein [Chiloscyllium punctatum]